MSQTNPKLEIVTPTADPHVNVFLYGGPKTGKTVGATSAPGPVLLLNADKPNAARMAHKRRGSDLTEAKMTGLETLAAVTFAAESGKYATVVIDPVRDVYRVLLEELSNNAMSPQLDHYGNAGTYLERFCRHLCDVPCNVVFIAHEQEVQNEEEGKSRTVRLPFVSTKSGSPVLAAQLLAMVDVIGYTGVVTEDGKPPKYMASLIHTETRRGGDRFGVLGQLRELDLSEWIALIRENDQETATKESQKEGAAK